MRFEYFPRSTENRYQETFAEAMGRRGIFMQPAERIEDQLLISRADQLDGIHFHWVEALIGHGSAMQRARAILGLRRYLRTLKRLGKKLLWTVHNHARHDRGKWIDALAYRTVAKAADVIIVHSHFSGDYIRNRYHPAGRIVVMPHGNYDGYYHPKKSIAETRRAAGLREDVPVCGVIGSVRPYRGHELAIETASLLSNDCQLFIAGKAAPEDYAAKLRAMTDGKPNIRCALGRLTDDAYAEALRACDIILLPYNEVTSSGALLSAWSMARPIVATALPLFEEFERGQLSPGALKTAQPTPAGFADAVRELLKIDRAAREAAAQAESDRYSWDAVTAPVAEAVFALKPRTVAAAG